MEMLVEAAIYRRRVSAIASAHASASARDSSFFLLMTGVIAWRRESWGVEHLLVDLELQIRTTLVEDSGITQLCRSLLARALGRDSRRNFFLLRYSPGKKLSRNVQPFLLIKFYS